MEVPTPPHPCFLLLNSLSKKTKPVKAQNTLFQKKKKQGSRKSAMDPGVKSRQKLFTIAIPELNIVMQSCLCTNSMWSH